MSAFLRIPIVGISALIQMEMAENAQWWVIVLIVGAGILLIGCGWVLLVLYFNLCTVAAIPRERMEEEKDGKKQETEKENREKERERREKEEKEEEKKEEEKRGGREREREETERRANEEHTEKKREHDQPQKSTTVSSKSWRRRRKKAPKLRKMVGALRRRNGRGKKKGEMEEEEEDEAEEEEKRTTEMEGKRRGSEAAAGRGGGKDWSFPKNGGERRTTKELGTKSVSVCPKLANPIDAMVRNGRTAPPSRLRPYWVADQLEGIYHLFQSPSTHPRPGPKAKDGEIRAEIVEG